MDITISPHNLKRFAASITCLGKIGKDLYLSFDPLDGLTLSSLNEAKSAFGKFHFEPGFFEKCTTTTGASVTAATSSSAGGVAVGGGRGNRTANRNDIPRGNQNHGGGSRTHQHYRTNNNDDDGENDNNDEEDQDDNADKYDARYVCRVPVRSIHSILRPRKGVLSLRIRSEGVDYDGNYFGLNRRKQGKGGDEFDNENANGRGRDRHGHRRHRGSGSRSRSKDVDDYESDEDNTSRKAEHRRRSGSYSSRERSRSRMRRKQNKNHDDNDIDNDDGDDANGISHNTAKMMLSFEYNIECLTSKNNDNHRRQNNHSNNQSNNNSANNSGGKFRVLHKVGVTDCNGISLSESISQRRTRSEIIAHPRLWLRLIDPLRRTPEMALTIDDELKVVTATSFHPMEVVQSRGGNTNAILQAAVARNAMLKTETSMGADEFDEFDFRNNRGKKKREKSRSIRDADSEEEDENEDDAGDDEGTNDDEREEGEDRDRPPVDVNRKVILVFSIKEAKVSGLLSFTCLVYSIFKTD